MDELNKFSQFLDTSIDLLEEPFPLIGDVIGISNFGSVFASIVMNLSLLDKEKIAIEINKNTSIPVLKRMNRKLKNCLEKFREIEDLEFFVGGDKFEAIRFENVLLEEIQREDDLFKKLLNLISSLNRILEGSSRFYPSLPFRPIRVFNGDISYKTFVEEWKEYRNEFSSKLNALIITGEKFIEAQNEPKKNQIYNLEDLRIGLKYFSSLIVTRISQLNVPVYYFEETIFLEAAADIVKKLELI